MILKKLLLLCFRNYLYQEIDFNTEFNVFVGDNAQGKTNILESIYLLTSLRSFRPIENSQIIYWQKQSAQIEGTLQELGIERNQKVLIEPRGKKAFINHNFVRKSAEYLEKMSAISFHPGDLHIIQGPPILRRRYLDRAMMETDPNHESLLTNYYRALMQRNAALKREMEEKSSMLTWGEKLHSLGARVLSKRLQFISQLNTLVSALYSEISGCTEQVQVKYESFGILKDFNGLTEKDLLGILLEKQEEIIQQEKILKRSLVGPHRDDFSVWVKERNLKIYGSQGEQRTAILALKLAELVHIEQERRMKAIFLLDDVASELDDKRKTVLFQILKQKQAQVFITTTDLHSLKLENQRGTVFGVKGGQVSVV